MYGFSLKMNTPSCIGRIKVNSKNTEGAEPRGSAPCFLGVTLFSVNILLPTKQNLLFLLLPNRHYIQNGYTCLLHLL